MSFIPGKENRRVRSLFVSDVHLGCKHSQAEAFLEFLQKHQPEYLYVVGDFIDGWKLRRRWRWLPEYDAIFKQLVCLHRAGTKLFYTPGNHDSFLRGFVGDLEIMKWVSVNDEFVHETADRRRFLVTHGDKFDTIETNAPWLSLLSSYAYDTLLTLNRWVNRWRGDGHDRYVFCAAVKRQVKFLVKLVSDFERRLAISARKLRCDGIICGHIHVPRISHIHNLVYCNTGDWVENCSALVEYDNGLFELMRSDGSVIARLEADGTLPLPKPMPALDPPPYFPLLDELPAGEEMLVA